MNTNGNGNGPNRAPGQTRAHGNSNGPAKFVPVAYTAAEELRIQRQLNRVLGPEYVSFRPGGGGQNVSYIEGWKALNLANEIFGFNGWLSELVSVQVDFMDSHGLGRVSLGLSVVVRITIKDGTFHEDFGYGFIENAKSKAVAFEKCKKEAFTDGLKRCLRCFGNVLGNCLYEKGIVAKIQKAKLPVPELDADDFHRDPLVVKRERQREQREREQAVQNSTPNSATPPVTTPPAAAAAKPRAYTPVVVKGTDLGDFDDLFVFSDDLPANELDDRLDEMELEMLAKEQPDKAPSAVFFTSSRKALDVQKMPEGEIPVYDHKFIAGSVKRTVDPSVSAKIRRADLPSAHTPSQMNRVASPGAAPTLGKRPLGMPPSQRPGPKRPHREGEKAHREGEKENAVS